jgi:MFS family permease
VWALGKLPKQMPSREKRSAELQSAPGSVISLSELMRSSQFWTISLAVATMIGANTGTMVSLVGFAKASGLSTAQGSYLLSLLALCAMVGKVVLGAASDRLSHRTALQLGIGSQICGMAVLASASSYLPMLIGAGMFGLGLGAMMPVWGAAMAAVFGLASYGRVLGWSRAVMTPVSMVFPIVAAWIFDRTASYNWAWMLFAALLALAFVGTLSLRTGSREPVTSTAR